MWQVRRGLNILHGATPETLKDLFATTSEVEKMDGMVQTLQSMLAVIEARKAVVLCLTLRGWAGLPSVRCTTSRRRSTQ